MTEELREDFKEMESEEEKKNLLISLKLFPACGHHRVEASKELAREQPDEMGDMLIWDNVKVIAPPGGSMWVDCVRILGIMDNLPFGRRLGFADHMTFLRREYVEKYMPAEGHGFRKPASENARKFRETCRKVFGISGTSSKLTAAIGLLSRSHAVYDLVHKVIVGDVKEHPTQLFVPLGSPMTIHCFAQLPDDLCIELLLKVVNREIQISDANKQGKELLHIAAAREFVISVARKAFPKRTRDFEIWAHYSAEWPNLEDLIGRSLGYFQKSGKSKRQNIPYLETETIETMKSWDRLKAGTALEEKVDRDYLPFLKAAVGEEKCFVTHFQSQYFVLLNCTTEGASQFLKPREYGQSFFQFFFIFFFFIFCDI